MDGELAGLGALSFRHGGFASRSKICLCLFGLSAFSALLHPFIKLQ